MERFTFFWHGPFSQWHACRFKIDGVVYNCAEQYMMAEKALLFGDRDAHAEIMMADHPRRQKAVGRQVRDFNQDLWNSKARDIVYRGNWAKFTQNDAPITTAAGPLMRKDVRNNARVMQDDVELADRLWQRAQPLLPARLREWRAVGFNERLRFYRYDVGEQFAIHLDGAYYRDNGEESKLTFMIYLNDGFEGGDTVFYYGREPRLTVQPERGMALVFVHRQLHEGAAVQRGRKYVLRTDVMYRREG